MLARRPRGGRDEDLYRGVTVDTVMPVERAALVAFVLATNLLMS